MDRLKLSKRGRIKLTRGKGAEETRSMDKNFMDKFNFIFGVIQTCAVVIGIIVGFIYIAQFSYSLGVIESKISILEEQNPIVVQK